MCAARRGTVAAVMFVAAWVVSIDDDVVALADDVLLDMARFVFLCPVVSAG